MLKIQKATVREVVVFTLSGRIKAEDVAELQRLFEGEADGHRMVLVGWIALATGRLLTPESPHIPGVFASAGIKRVGLGKAAVDDRGPGPKRYLSIQHITGEHGGTMEHEPPSAASAKRRMSEWVVILALFAVMFYLVLHRRDIPVQASSSQHGPGAAVSVTAATAKRGDIGVYLTAIGTVTPVYTSTITSQVSGIISAVHYLPSPEDR